MGMAEQADQIGKMLYGLVRSLEAKSDAAQYNARAEVAFLPFPVCRLPSTVYCF